MVKYYYYFIAVAFALVFSRSEANLLSKLYEDSITALGTPRQYYANPGYKQTYPKSEVASYKKTTDLKNDGSERFSTWIDDTKDVIRELLHQLSEYKLFKDPIKCILDWLETGKDVILAFVANLPESKMRTIQEILIKLLSKFLDKAVW